MSLQQATPHKWVSVDFAQIHFGSPTVCRVICQSPIKCVLRNGNLLAIWEMKAELATSISIKGVDQLSMLLPFSPACNHEILKRKTGFTTISSFHRYTKSSFNLEGISCSLWKEEISRALHLVPISNIVAIEARTHVWIEHKRSSIFRKVLIEREFTVQVEIGTCKLKSRIDRSLWMDGRLSSLMRNSRGNAALENVRQDLAIGLMGIVTERRKFWLRRHADRIAGLQTSQRLRCDLVKVSRKKLLNEGSPAKVWVVLSDSFFSLARPIWAAIEAKSASLVVETAITILLRLPKLIDSTEQYSCTMELRRISQTEIVELRMTGWSARQSKSGERRMAKDPWIVWTSNPKVRR